MFKVFPLFIASLVLVRGGERSGAAEESFRNTSGAMIHYWTVMAGGEHTFVVLNFMVEEMLHVHVIDVSG